MTKAEYVLFWFARVQLIFFVMEKSKYPYRSFKSHVVRTRHNSVRAVKFRLVPTGFGCPHYKDHDCTLSNDWNQNYFKKHSKKIIFLKTYFYVICARFPIGL